MSAASLDSPYTIARRRLSGGALALVASLGAHAALAAIAGVSLWALGARARPPADGVEIEIAEVRAPVEIDVPAPAPPAPVPPAARVSVRRSAARALAAPPRATVAPSSAPQPTTESPPAPDDAPGPPAVFAMSSMTVATHATAPAAAGPLQAGSPGGAPAGAAVAEPVVDAAAVDVPATLVVHPPARYPPAARQAQVEGDVPVEIIVGTDGTVGSARVLVNQGYGLDAAALQAVRAYRFTPARRAGHPVRVRMRWTVQFRLK